MKGDGGKVLRYVPDALAEDTYLRNWTCGDNGKESNKEGEESKATHTEVGQDYQRVSECRLGRGSDEEGLESEWRVYKGDGQNQSIHI